MTKTLMLAPLTLGILLAPLGTLAERLEEVDVEATAPVNPTRTQAPAEAREQALPADAADALRELTGVSGARMGGRALEPVIRGQSQNRLNVILDGAYVHGGCPNRMDPPTSYAPMDSYDDVEVIKGFQSVLYGGGGSGGTVLVKRRLRPLPADKPWDGHIRAGFKGNSDTRNLSADLSLGSGRVYGRGSLSYQDAGNYDDGDGHRVRSAYETRAGALMLGLSLWDGGRLEASVDLQRDRDTLYAGAGMDSPASDLDSYRLKFSQDLGAGPFDRIEAEAYRNQVDHEMNNYSLRPVTAPMKMRTLSASDTSGGRFQTTLGLAGDGNLDLGADYQYNRRNANLFSGPKTLGGDPARLDSILWPDVALKQLGLFAQGDLPLGEDLDLFAGLRYDRVTSEARRAAEKGKGLTSPDDLYRTYYGTRAKKAEEDNLSGFLRLEQALGTGDDTAYLALSRAVRTADASERFLAKNAMKPALRWIGNPGLAPEKHLQIEAGVEWAGAAWRAGGSVYYDHVDDYILRDKAAGQAGIRRSDGASIYRNIGARLWGVEVDAHVRPLSHWQASLGLAYVNARNTDDGRWLPQTPPLEGHLGLDYGRGRWSAGGVLRFAATQHDVDVASGQDVGETPGWGALDLYGRYRVSRILDLRLGVDNVFDQTYAYHVNRANSDPFNPEAIQVNEPGRSFWADLSAHF